MRFAGGVARLARGARRIGRAARGRAAVLAVVALVGVVAVVMLGRRTDEPAPGSGALATVRVGVSDGDSVPRYLAEQREELDRLVAGASATPVYALVSFGRYLDPAQVSGATAGSEGLATVFGFARVPVPDRQTELVRLPANRIPDDLVVGMVEVADRKADQAAGYRAEAGRDEGGRDEGGRDEGARARSESIAAVLDQEAAAYRAAGPCVYALLVRATPARLAVLAGRDDVRVVDAAPELTDVAAGVFLAPLPEQVDTAGPLPQAVRRLTDAGVANR